MKIFNVKTRKGRLNRYRAFLAFDSVVTGFCLSAVIFYGTRGADTSAFLMLVLSVLCGYEVIGSIELIQLEWKRIEKLDRFIAWLVGAWEAEMLQPTLDYLHENPDPEPWTSQLKGEIHTLH